MLPDGTLVDIFEDLNGSGRQHSPNQFHQSVIRSTDNGVIWSKVIDISNDGSVAVRDPDTGAFVHAGAGLPDIAVGPEGHALRGLVGRPLQRFHARRRRALTLDGRRPDLVGADQGERVAVGRRRVHALRRTCPERHGGR